MKVEEALCPLVVKITVLVHGFAGVPDSIAVCFVHFMPVGSPLTDALDAIPVKSIFTGTPGKYVPLKETVRGFREIIEGKHDEIPESCFLYAGTIDEVVEKYRKEREGK